MYRPRLCLFLCALFALMAVRYAHKAADEERSAINRWRPQLARLADGVDISTAHNYPHPPMMAVLLEPLARLDSFTCAMTWYALKSAFAVASLLTLLRLAEESIARPLPDRAAWLIVALSLKPVLDDLSHGNVNLFLLALLTGCLWAHVRGYGAVCGLLLGLAIACRVTPLLLLPYFALRREWRVVAFTVVGLALFAYPGFVPAARLGWENHSRQLSGWVNLMAKPYLGRGEATTEYLNQSLPGVAGRLLTRSPSLLTWQGDTEVPARYDNVADWPRWAVKGVVLGCMGVFAAGVWVVAKRPHPPTPSPFRSTSGDGGVGKASPKGGGECEPLSLPSCPPLRFGEGGRGGEVASFALVLVGTLLFSERTWKHHAVLLAPAFAVAVAAVVARPRLRVALVPALAVAAVLMLLPAFATKSSRESATFGAAKLSLVYGAYLWAFVSCAAVTYVVARDASVVRQDLPPEHRREELAAEPPADHGEAHRRDGAEETQSEQVGGLVRL